jgi:hypothetical protein
MMIYFRDLLTEAAAIDDQLRDMYFQITGAGEEDEYSRAYEKIVPFLKQAVEGGRLEHLRPKNGITLYRGYGGIDKQRKNTAKSYSKYLETAKFFAGKDGKIDKIIVTPDLPAIDFNKILRGALAGEVIIFV